MITLRRASRVFFDEQEPNNLRMVWQSLFKKCNEVVAALGEDDFEVEQERKERALCPIGFR